VEENVDEENDIGEPIFAEVDKGREVIYANQWESLMVCRSLRAGHLVEDDCLQNNIFHCRLTYHGKVCGESCKNVVVSNIVKKLKHKKEDNPKPYKIS
jgi:hypothetical protein